MSQQKQQKTKFTSLWSIFLTIFLILLIILLFIYISIAIWYSMKYNKLKDDISAYLFSNLKYQYKQIPKDIKIDDINVNKESYDFDKDPQNLKNLTNRLGRDLIDNLLWYYDNNLNTVTNVINNIIPSRGKGPSGITGMTEAINKIDFIETIIRNVPYNVLASTTFFATFYQMLLIAVIQNTTHVVHYTLKTFR